MATPIDILNGDENLAQRRLGSGDTEMTVYLLIAKLAASCPNFQRRRIDGARVIDVTSKQMSADAGMMSCVYRLDVKFDNSETLLYCLKEPRTERIEKVLNFDFFEALTEINDRECDFYEKVANEVRGLIVPHVHAIKRLNKDVRYGYILLDFAGGDAGRPVPIEHSLTLNQMLVVADQIARLHAYGWTHREQLTAENWATVNIACNDPNTNEPFMVYHRKALAEKNIDPSILERIDKLNDVYLHPSFTNWTVFEAHKALGLPDMFGHGDLWANNIVVKTNTDGSLSSHLAGIIDWQQASVGSPVQDLLRLMLLNMDTDDRRKHTSAVYDHYYERFKLHLLAANWKEPPPYERAALDAAARPYMFYQVALCIFITIHNFDKPEQQHERDIFVERLRGGLDDAIIIRDTYLQEWIRNNPQ